MTFAFAFICFVLASLVPHFYCTRICFSCTDLKENDTCHNAIPCRENEECFVQKYLTLRNEIRYDVGCMYSDAHACNKDAPGSLFGRRSDHSHILCQKCCNNADVCNNDRTCDDVPQGPIQKCSSCSAIDRPDMCNSTIFCGKDEVCFVQKYSTAHGRQYYDLGCKQSSLCPYDSYSNLVGRRMDTEIHYMCESCCAGNESCNKNLDCSHSIYNALCSNSTECLSDLTCISGRCQCISDQFVWANFTCVSRCKTMEHWNGSSCVSNGDAIYNSLCSNSSDCFSTFTHLICNSGRCQCLSDDYGWSTIACYRRCKMTEYWNGFSCILKKSYNAECRALKECSDTLVCSLGFCKCDRTNYWNGTKCVGRKTYNMTCSKTEECNESLLLRCSHGKCSCISSEYWTGTFCETTYPTECDDIHNDRDGVYTIFPTGPGKGVSVFCVMGAQKKWTVIQRRENGSLSFDRTWNEYKHGFGSPHGEYWLGNDHIHTITTNGHHEISFYLEESASKFGYANYSTFHIGDEGSNYLLNISGYSGNTYDDMDRTGYTGGFSNGMQFSTKDRDHDHYSRNCAVYNGGAWWYNRCSNANVNKKYDLLWYHFSSNIKKSIMMVRRSN